MRTEYPIDKKQNTLKREFHKLSSFITCQKTNFDLCPVLPNFTRMPHTILKLHNPICEAFSYGIRHELYFIVIVGEGWGRRLQFKVDTMLIYGLSKWTLNI